MVELKRVHQQTRGFWKKISSLFSQLWAYVTIKEPQRVWRHTTTMGQAFRRASGRIRAASEADTSSFSKSKTAVDRQPPPNAAADKAAQIPKAAEQDVLHTGMSFSLCRFKVFGWKIRVKELRKTFFL